MYLLEIRGHQSDGGQELLWEKIPVCQFEPFNDYYYLSVKDSEICS